MKTKIEPRTIDWSLYAILDKKFSKGRSLAFLAEEVIEVGAGIVQLRDKISAIRDSLVDAQQVKEVTRRHGIPLIINDRLDIALAVNAEGIHLGQQDLPIKAAKELIRDKMIIGSSVHNLHEFHAAVDGGADYLGVGTIYPTKTKNESNISGVEIIELLRPKTDLPMVAIGGITVENLTPVIQAGADGVAVISALLDAADVRTRAMEFVQKIKNVKRSFSN